MPGADPLKPNRGETRAWGVTHFTDGSPMKQEDTYLLSWDGPSVRIEHRKTGCAIEVPFPMVLQFTRLTPEIEAAIAEGVKRRAAEEAKRSTAPRQLRASE